MPKFSVYIFSPFFLKTFLEDTSPFRGPLIPLFCNSSDICPGFQSQGGSLFTCFLACVILRFTSGVTPADCIEVGMVVEPFPSMYLWTCLQALVEVQGWNPSTTVRTAGTALYTTRPLRLGLHLFTCFASNCEFSNDKCQVIFFKIVFSPSHFLGAPSFPVSFCFFFFKDPAGFMSTKQNNFLCNNTKSKL